MNKTIALLLAYISCIHFCHAQGFYIKAAGGYAFPLAQQEVLQELTYHSELVGNNTVTTQKTGSVKGSYGAGTSLNLSFGYKFSPFIGFDLNLNYLRGQAYKATSSSTSSSSSTTATINQETSNEQGVLVSPAMIFMAGTGSVRPYATAGAIVGLTKLVDRSTLVYVVEKQESTLESEEETTGDISIGFRGGIGLEFILSKRIGFFTEALVTSMNFSPNESEYTKYIVNGDDNLDKLTIHDKKAVYSNSITIISGSTQDDDTPRQELRQQRPLSSISVNMGFKIRFYEGE